MKESKKIRLSKLSSFQLIVLLYLVGALFSTVLLMLPIAHKPGVDISFIDTMFVAVSALSVTGLTPVSIVNTFSTTGYVFILFILQVGGVGVMTFSSVVWIIFGKKIGIRERQLIMADQNRTDLAGLVKLMKEIFLLILAIEAVGAIILGVYFLPYYPSASEAFLHGLFGSISATTNGGFDITGQSLVIFADDYFVQFINMILIILGAIGFPVLVEVKNYLTYRGPIKFHFSLFTKLTTIVYAILAVFGAISIYLLERSHFFADKSWHESFFYSTFQSVAARSGGLTTLDLNEFSTATLLLLAILMFIGASPSSMGGGLRTTTFAIAILGVYFYARGKDTIKLFHREVHPIDLRRASVVMTTGFVIWFISIILLAFFEPDLPILKIVFEISSAFGTTGFSLGITDDLSTPSKLLIMTLMFIGRIGLFSLLFIIRGKTIKDTYHFPRERIFIG
ncbi:TrkH family potassium uptake protein [Bacillus thermotolerans]|uniref:Potassium uptake protein, integral membrane component, KtrB n=1 Tax=Bacillus thermotolerans TaxID=1221996 RepID=A0A0F5HRF8_BACTR|nr:TrkH family potassium uptake protein [Bacillus thermotolerans]KKB35432.1 Potassium uptake protein, integral membrane component, KtrB [Bacillus thermotolerans]KKB39014.1 Potassium uptake protein, integral membrane component, KtrB [Bacillus thermotolerans]